MELTSDLFQCFYKKLYRILYFREYGKYPVIINEKYGSKIWTEKIKQESKDVFRAGYYFDVRSKYFYDLYLDAKEGKDIDIDNLPYFKALLFIDVKQINPELDFLTIFKANKSRKKYEDDKFWKPCLDNLQDLHRRFREENLNGCGDSNSTTQFTKTSDKKLTEAQRKPYFPKFLGIVPSRTDVFIGRNKELEDLLGSIIEAKKFVFLHGVPGIGKTSLAKAFVEKYRDKFDHFAWINITTVKQSLPKENADSNQLPFKEAFSPLYIFLNGGKKEINLEIDEQFKFTLGRLNNIEGNNLLIIDNADESIVPHMNTLPGAPYWKVLVTTRSRVVANSISLDSLSDDDARKLFNRFYNKDVNEKLLEEFLKEIDYHTLMIEVAAKSLNESNSITLESLYQRLVKGQLDDPELDQTIKTEHGDEDGKLIKHLLLLFRIDTLKEEEIKLLRTWYYLRPRQYNIKEISDFTGISQENGHIQSLLFNLDKIGWIVYVSREKLYSIHPLIQKTIFYSLSPLTYDIQPLLLHYNTHLNAREFDINALLIIQANCEYLSMLADLDVVTNPYMFEFNYNVAKAYQRLGILNKSKFWFEKSVHICDRMTEYNIAISGPLKRIALISISDILTSLREFADAERILLEILSCGVYEGETSTQNWQNALVDIYQNLIIIYSQVGNIDSTETYLHKLNILIEQIEDNKSLIFEKKLRVLLKIGNFNNAIKICEQLSEKYCEESEKSDSLIYALDTATHGIALEGLNKFDEALNYYNLAASAISEKAIKSPSLPFYMVYETILTCIGRVLGKKGEIKESLAIKEMHKKYLIIALYKQPQIWTYTLIKLIELAQNSEKPVPVDIIEMIRFVGIVIYKKNNDGGIILKNAGLTKEIFGWSEDCYNSFIRDISTDSLKS